MGYFPDNYSGNSNVSSNPFGGGRMPQGMGGLLMMLFGNKIWPLVAPGTPQGQFDALWQRHHDIQMQQIGRNAVANWFPIKNLGGLNTGNPLSQIGMALAGQPDGMIAKMMAPVLGGNPVLAQMSTFANMQGINMAGLGTLRGMNQSQISSSMGAFDRNFYSYGQRDDAQINKIYGDRRASVTGSLTGTDLSTGGLFDDKTNRVLAGSSAYNNIADRKDDLDKLDDVLRRFGKDSKVEDVRNSIDKMEFSDTDKGNSKFKADIVSAIEKAHKEGAGKYAEAVATAMHTKDIASVARIINMGAAATEYTKGVNYQHTLGFNYEDLTGAMNASISNRLTNGESYNKLVGAFSGGRGAGTSATVGALDASRSFFGNDLSGKELINQLSDFVGGSNVDVGSDSGAKMLEDRLRSVKATARVGNIDFEQLRGMINQATQLASTGSATSKFGGMETSKIVEDAFMNTAGLSSGMTPQSVRWMGGTTGMIAGRTQGTLESANDRISSQLAALYHQAGNDQALKNRILNYSRNGDTTSLGYAQFLNTMPGGATAALQFADQNKNATRLGFQDAPELMKMGGKSRVASAFQQLYVRYGGGQQGQAMVDRARGLLAKGDLNEFLADKYTNVGEFAGMWQGLAEKGYLDDSMLALNPHMKAERDRMVKDKNESAKFDAQVSRTMGHMNAPILQRVVQSVINGSVSEHGISSIFKAMGVDDSGAMYTQALQSSAAIKNINAATDITGALGSMGVGGESSKQFTDTASLASKYGLTAGQLRNLKDGAKLKDVLGDETYNKARGATTNGLNDLAELQRLGKKFAGNSDFKDYNGDFSLDSLKTFGQNAQSDKVIDSAAEASGIPKLARENMLKAMQSQDSTFSGMLDKGLTSLAGTDADKAYDILDKARNESEGDRVRASGHGGFAVAGAQRDLMASMGMQVDNFASTDTADAAIKKFNDQVDKTGAGQLATKHAEFTDEINKAKETAHDANISIPKLLQDILKKLEMPGMTTSIQNVANAINGVPPH